MTAKKKSALGRGLSALIDDASDDFIENIAPQTSAPILEIQLGKIEVNPFQPRTEFDQEALEELAESIQQLGIIQPITVRDMGSEKYQLISGERRLRAAKIAGLEAITAYTRKANDQEMIEMALVENIQREDLDAIEVAISYQRLMDECKLTQEAVSGRVGKKRSTITNYLRLLKLPAEIQLGIRKKKLSMGHARTLVNIDKKEDQLDVFFKVIEEGLSVRKTEEIVREINMPKQEKENRSDKESIGNDRLDGFKNDLSKQLNTNIDLKVNNKGRGKIVISFKSNEELEKLMNIFRQLNN